MLKKILKNDIASFVIKFLVLYGVFYGFNYIYTGLTVPGGSYSPWLDHNADYISGLRNFILNGASTLLSWLGYDNRVYGYFMEVIDGKTIRMVYSCIGLSILCMWWAFIISFPQSLKNKLIYFFGGTAFIIGLNIIRIALVAIAPRNLTIFNIPVDHHDIFNIVVYGIIILFIFRIINKSSKDTATSE